MAMHVRTMENMPKWRLGQIENCLTGRTPSQVCRFNPPPDPDPDTCRRDGDAGCSVQHAAEGRGIFHLLFSLHPAFGSCQFPLQSSSRSQA